jgi:hypothetical protein
MKKLFSIAILFFAASFWNITIAQIERAEELYLPKENGKVVYQSIIELPGVEEKEIFKRVNFWFVDAFKSPNDVINYNNPEEGVISGKGNLNLTWVNEKAAIVIPITVKLAFSVRIEVKEEKMRYSIYDIVISDLTLINFRAIESEFTQEKMYSKKGKPNKHSWDWYYLYEDAIRSLERSIKISANESQSKDW